MTSTERWQRLSRLFDAALELPAHERSAWLASECADDPALRKELEQMLAADSEPHQALDGDIAQMLGKPEMAEEDASGQMFDRWHLLRKLGRGGMGTVYHARREDDSGQQAAIKHLRRRWDGSAQAQRFLHERRILARLSHPGIPALIDHGLDSEARPWFALEYVQGKDLLRHADQAQLDLRQRIELFRHVCAAVQHAHAHLVIHRDLKPANILVDEEGNVRVLDFGAAKELDRTDETLTTSIAAFTPEYAAPEQISAKPISTATDVYALGVTLYELLCGQRPYQLDSHNLHANATAITEQPPERMDKMLTTGTAEEIAERIARRKTSKEAFRRFVRGDLNRIIQTALAKEPERRYASVQAFSDDLQRFLENRPVSVSGDTAGYRMRKFVSRNRWATAMGATAVVAIVAGMAGTLWQLHKAREQTRIAQQERDVAMLESERTAAMRDYFVLMFRNVGMEKGTHETTAKQMLERGAKDIAERYRDEPEIGMPLSASMAEISMVMGDPSHARLLYQQVLDWPGGEKYPQHLAIAQRNLASMELTLGNLPSARELLDQAQAFWASNPALYSRMLLDSRTIQAQLERHEGKIEEALATQRSALEGYRQLAAGKPSREAAVAAGNLASALQSVGRVSEALPYAEAARKEVAELGLTASSDGLAQLNNLAVIYSRLNRLPEAETHLRQVHDLHLQMFPDSIGTATVESNLAFLLLQQDRPAEALPLARSGLERALALGATRSFMTMNAYAIAMEAELAAGNSDTAYAHLRSTQALMDLPGIPPTVMANVRHAQAGVLLARGKHAEARTVLEKAEEALAPLGKPGECLATRFNERKQRLGMPPSPSPHTATRLDPSGMRQC